MDKAYAQAEREGKFVPWYRKGAHAVGRQRPNMGFQIDANDAPENQLGEPLSSQIQLEAEARTKAAETLQGKVPSMGEAKLVTQGEAVKQI